ncbi:helix-turn-helix transcriptional regulator [Aerococcus sp. UMB8608]|uniref:HTH cro/C1-type domain-containing protein n=1 Tax=Aerococcus sanguinicola TaxID=119206 RepID=A0A0X8FCN9_9LACT|nr:MULTISPECIES: helix-turn-helix transcriptional regulator [Aerococcus]AMB94908.1 hypothetical protein AWM72_09140 [Aerococcus sanguinicola]MDK6679357.1 helix-turn-helix transcriptional regulator [Aerococcus sp. UMB8608]MDK6685801.1 helix-turn-helix transcriptional regulator [Aerococcus sp. UMB8623]OFT95893.1 hypothetical protein HMPREF3090_03475 [Aerococcus sp. HMSC23C02]
MIGLKIKELRNYLKMTQKQFSERINISQNYLSEIENGRKNPSTALLSKIVEEFDLDDDYFLSKQPLKLSTDDTQVELEQEIDAIKQRVVSDMKSLGVYKPEYNILITIFVNVVREYELRMTQYQESGYALEDLDGRKLPITKQLETLRKDIITYSDRLCLNPKTYQSLNLPNEKSGSKLAEVLSSIGG